MINVNTFREAVFAQANKDGMGFKPNAVEFNSFLADGMRGVRNYLFGTDAQYQPGRPVPNVSSQKTRLISEAERYWMERRTLQVQAGRLPVPDGVNVIDSSGQVCPAFGHLDKIVNLYIPAGETQVTRREVRVLPSRDVERVLNSEINVPTQFWPVAELDKNAYIVYPSNLTFCELIYLRIPQSPVWGFTVDNALPARQRREIYDPATSIDIDLPDEMSNLLKERVLNMMAIRERDQFMAQASAGRDKQGVR